MTPDTSRIMAAVRAHLRNTRRCTWCDTYLFAGEAAPLLPTLLDDEYRPGEWECLDRGPCDRRRAARLVASASGYDDALAWLLRRIATSAPEPLAALEMRAQ